MTHAEPWRQNVPAGLGNGSKVHEAQERAGRDERQGWKALHGAGALPGRPWRVRKVPFREHGVAQSREVVPNGGLITSRNILGSSPSGPWP